jgi:hypothetical protein
MFAVDANVSRRGSLVGSKVLIHRSEGLPARDMYDQ